MAGQESLRCEDLCPPAHHTHYHVLFWRHHLHCRQRAHLLHSQVLDTLRHLLYVFHCLPSSHKTLIVFPGHAANVYTVMSIEASVGIACGCLPGCKPLLSRMFPRVFGASSGNSVTRTPKRSGNRSSGSSFPLSTLSRDIVVKEVGYKVEYSDLKTSREWKQLPTPPPPPPPPTAVQSRRTSYSRVFGFPHGRPRDEGFSQMQSDSSQELIILQGVEHLRRKCEV
jgi:hypothetical protein